MDETKDKVQTSLTEDTAMDAAAEAAAAAAEEAVQEPAPEEVFQSRQKTIRQAND